MESQPWRHATRGKRGRRARTDGLLVVELRAHGAQSRPVDRIRLAVARGDQALALQLAEDGQRAVGEDQSFTGVAGDGGDVAVGVALVHDATAFGEDVQGPLLGS
jgi:hypothetical protein